MKKWLIFLAMATLGALPGRAQVYSSNVVGYVNVFLTNGYTFVVSQLSYTNNGLIYLFHQPPENSRVFAWDVTNQVFLPPAVFNSGSWTTNYDLPPGRGFIVYSPSPWTNTFVGTVLQGSLSQFVAGSNRLSLLGSMVPLVGRISTDLDFPKLEGCDVHLFRPETQTFSDPFTYYTNHGWFDPKGMAESGEPAIRIAESFLIQNPGPPTNWTTTFIVNRPPPGPALSPPPAIKGIKLVGNRVLLFVDSHGGKRYNVQFSTDRESWMTIATNQTRTVWSNDLPLAMQGFFRLVNPIK